MKCQHLWLQYITHRPDLPSGGLATNGTHRSHVKYRTLPTFSYNYDKQTLWVATTRDFCIPSGPFTSNKSQINNKCWPFCRCEIMAVHSSWVFNDPQCWFGQDLNPGLPLPRCPTTGNCKSNFNKTANQNVTLPLRSSNWPTSRAIRSLDSFSSWQCLKPAKNIQQFRENANWTLQFLGHIQIFK